MFWSSMTGPWRHLVKRSAAKSGRSVKTATKTRSTILTSQLPVARWHEQIGDPTVADGILDRLVHNAHRIEMKGDSMRRKRGGGGSSGRRLTPPGPLHCRGGEADRRSFPRHPLRASARSAPLR